MIGRPRRNQAPAFKAKVPLAEILFRARYRVIRGRSSRHDIAFIREPARWLESASLSLRRSLSVWI
jgi:hypothetical protein